MKTLNYLVISSLLTIIGSTSQPAMADSKGTHFLVEPYTGLVYSEGLYPDSTIGSESGALLAIGGKFKGFPPRFYLYFRAAHTTFGDDELYTSSIQTMGCATRSYTRLMGGLRMVLPLFWKVRLNMEIGAGRMASYNRYSENDRQLISYDESLTVAEIGVGLNLRLFKWLSLGVMYDRLFVAQAGHEDLITAFLVSDTFDEDIGFSSLTATVGIHF